MKPTYKPTTDDYTWFGLQLFGVYLLPQFLVGLGMSQFLAGVFFAPVVAAIFAVAFFGPLGVIFAITSVLGGIGFVIIVCERNIEAVNRRRGFILAGSAGVIQSVFIAIAFAVFNRIPQSLG